MKKLFLLFTFTNFCAIAQTDSSYIRDWHFGLSSNYIFPEYLTDAITNSIYFSKGHHYISIGPRQYLDNDKKYHRFGLGANYRYIPNSVNKCLNFYFTALFSTDSEHFQKTSYYANISGYTYKESEYFYMALHAGYGLDVRFCKVIHFNQFIGIGFYTNKEKTYVEDNQSGIVHARNQQIKLFTSYIPSMVISIGFAVDVFKVKEKLSKSN